MSSTIAIVGAGCAGLSFAVELVRAGLGRTRVVLFDERSDYTQDRTWCSWSVVPHSFRDAVSHRWSRWRVRTCAGEIVRTSSTTSYEHIPADRFYALARRELGNAVELRLGNRVTALTDHGSYVEVQVGATSLRADLVLDARPASAAPARPERGDVSLFQVFRGFDVETEQAAFDPSTATLMDFASTQQSGVHFVYELPFAPNRALVEATWFSTTADLDDDAARRSVELHLARRHGVRRFEILREERGILPMSTREITMRSSARIIRIGLAGGFGKPSSGYAFASIQRFARAYAPSLLRALPSIAEPPRARSRVLLELDRLLLRRIVDAPHDTPELFARLFARTPPDVLARFLSEQVSLTDVLVVMNAAPRATMLGAALRSYASRIQVQPR